MAFSPEYIRLVLNENFEDAKTLFLVPLMAIHRAHLTMLAETRIVPIEDARRLRDALDRIDLDAIRATPFDGTSEDLFFHVDRLVAASCGREVAGRLHTARSRNDIDMTLYRMRVREFLLVLMEAILELRRSLLDLAEKHVTTIFPAHTHTQPAQPTSVAHYLLAVVEQLERDDARFLAAFRTANRCPLGACAITGTGFPIDRVRTSDLLGFDAPTGNTYGSIAAADYLLEGAAATAVAVAGVGRFVQDMLLWCTSEVGYLRLADGLVQTSSIMPQKRNPSALEHARALLSRALGQATALPTAVHNTPFGDIVDTEDDLQPLVASVFTDAARALMLVAVTVAGADLAVDRMRERAHSGWVTVTELADTLVREHGVPFGTAHQIAGRLIRGREAHPDARLSDLLVRVSGEVLGREIRLDETALMSILSPEHFIAVRKTLGGPAPDVVKRALGHSEARLAADGEVVSGARGSLATADGRLAAAVQAL
ncbi:MAG TPA: argininosuccinate lyase [Vicinamibacterales bacterium]|nr:argininosuccinate lyase [Vicinamibacterales bacterium]